jgi:hypothetical protein
MRVGRRLRSKLALAVGGFVLAPCSPVLGAPQRVAASDSATVQAIVGRVEERSALDSVARVMVFCLLSGGAALLTTRRLWVDEADSNGPAAV